MSAPHLKIGGDLIKDAILSSVEVTQELNKHWWCTVVCRQTEDKRFPVEQCLGQDLEIITFDQDGNPQVVFDGLVVDVELTYEIWGSYEVQLTGVTRSYKMDLTERKKYYTAKTLSDIASELASNAGLEATLNHPQKKALNYVQWGETDFDFLHRIVDDYGCWLRPAPNGVDIYDSFQRGGKLQWRGEEGLLRFKTKGTLSQPSFNGAHYDFHQMKSQTYSNVTEDAQFFGSISPMVDAVKNQSKKLMPPGYIHQRSRVVQVNDFETLLKKESVRSIGSSISAWGESNNPQLTPGNTVAIEGSLDAHGTYGLTKVVHRWTSTGYRNEFWCTPWKNHTNPDPPPANKWLGVVPARVVDHNDPAKMGRIKIQYFWQEDNIAHWARMVTPHAGADRGFMFMPEVGDEVVVAFEDGDPERPVVFGSVWNGVDKAPRQGFWDQAEDVISNAELQSNDVKRIVTKSGNRIHMVDTKGQEAIVLATPGSIRVALINKANETGRETLLLESSAGDIIFNAPNGRIHFCAQHFSREIGAK
jgi:type VI secretion system secreted protein VgrG